MLLSLVKLCTDAGWCPTASRVKDSIIWQPKVVSAQEARGELNAYSQSERSATRIHVALLAFRTLAMAELSLSCRLHNTRSEWA